MGHDMLPSFRRVVQERWDKAIREGGPDNPPPRCPDLVNRENARIAIETLLAWIQEQQERETKRAEMTIADEQSANTAIYFHEAKKYSLDGKKSLCVPEELDNILQTFLEYPTAMETKELTDRSGVSNVSRAVKKLAEWNNGVFAPAVSMPEKKGKGGYFIRVKRL